MPGAVAKDKCVFLVINHRVIEWELALSDCLRAALRVLKVAHGFHHACSLRPVTRPRDQEPPWGPGVGTSEQEPLDWGECVKCPSLAAKTDFSRS